MNDSTVEIDREILSQFIVWDGYYSVWTIYIIF